MTETRPGRSSSEIPRARAGAGEWEIWHITETLRWTAAEKWDRPRQFNISPHRKLALPPPLDRSTLFMREEADCAIQKFVRTRDRQDEHLSRLDLHDPESGLSYRLRSVSWQ